MPSIPAADLQKRQDKHIETFLNLAQDDLSQAKLNRVRYIQLARDHGWSYGKIGDALGLTEAGVRQIIYRWNEADHG